MLNTPREIKVRGGVLQKEFQKHAAISIGTFAVVVRLLQLQQTWLYNKYAPNRNHWKHFMDPGFAVTTSLCILF
jgi:hypothetical protein